MIRQEANVVLLSHGFPIYALLKEIYSLYVVFLDMLSANANIKAINKEIRITKTKMQPTK